ncbi:MAG: tetratricopeptide repeat protein [Anaerolineae bacterium]|jgi:tetratricopeptide (TPR) repeat protein
MTLRHLLIVLLAASLCGSAQAKGGDEPVDYLALAALMLRDGNIDRAVTALDQVDTTAEDIDLVRYYTLRGMAHMRRNELEPARDAFSRAIGSGEPDAVVYVYLAQVDYRLEDYAGAVAALDMAGAAVERVPSVYHMRAQCYWLQDQPIMALATLDQASQVFPGDPSFLRRKVFYLVDLGLFREAVTLGREYLERSNGKVEDYVALGNALRASGELEEASRLLEQAQLLFPRSPEVKKVLAHVYIDREQLSAAADVLYQAALQDPALLGEAAELYRRSGQVYRALTLNSQLNDQPEKLRQRLALYLQMQNFEQAAAMEIPLRRVGLLEDEDIRYAIAYSLFKTGEFQAAETQLASLNRPDLFRKAAELRRAIQDCAEDSWKCL